MLLSRFALIKLMQKKLPSNQLPNHTTRRVNVITDGKHRNTSIRQQDRFATGTSSVAGTTQIPTALSSAAAVFNGDASDKAEDNVAGF